MKSKFHNTSSPVAKTKPGAVPAVRVLRNTKLSAEERDLIDRYVRARRREAAGKAAADALKSAVLALVQRELQVAWSGSLTCLDVSVRYHYSARVVALEKTLAEVKALEREDGTAGRLATQTVAWEDVRQRERVRREKMTAPQEAVRPQVAA